MSVDIAEPEQMAKKKSEQRQHTAIARLRAETLTKAKKAASLMELSLADWMDDVVAKAAERDLKREGKKLAGGEEK